MHPAVVATVLATVAALAGAAVGRLAHDGSLFFIFAAVVAAVFGGAAFLLVQRAVAAPLAALVKAAENLAQEKGIALPDVAGPLAPAAAAVQTLAEALESSRERVQVAEAQAEKWRKANKLSVAGAQKAKRRDTITKQSMLEAAGTLKEVSDSITTFAASLATDTGKVSEGAQVQRGRVESAAAAVEEMNATNMEVARSAQSAAEIAERTRGTAVRGAEVVSNSVSAIRELTGVMQGLRTDMEALGGKAESIGQVMTVIGDIADQTNLLALNAAIEAARAGEAGRGFAVVADEVRKLAEKTMSATKEVETVIRGIQEGSAKSLSSMAQAATAMTSAEESSGRSGEMLSEIVELANSTSDQMRAIAAASSQQSAASEDIARNMENLSRFSAETASDMTGAMESITRLDAQIQELVKLGGVFRIIAEGKVLAEVEQMAGNKDIASLDRARAEKAMRGYVDRLSFLELLYLTDGTGRQVTENIAPKDFKSANHASAFGKNWSSRPWYRGAVENKETFLSSIYVSDASGDYCLTVSVPIMERGEVAGVLGADIKLFG